MFLLYYFVKYLMYTICTVINLNVIYGDISTYTYTPGHLINT